MFARYVAKLKDETGIDPRIVSYYAPGSILAEQFRNISTYINSLNGGSYFQSVCITSANKQEGKSITCVNLAVSMAEDKEQEILIVNADFRSPDIETLLNVDSKKGLADYLMGSADLDDVVRTTAISNLKLLGAGAIPPKAAEVITAQKVKNLIVALKAKFSYIIFDTPALIPFADARVIAPLTDGVLLVVQAFRTRREVVARAQEQIVSVRGKLIGVVLTNVEYHIPEYILRHL